MNDRAEHPLPPAAEQVPLYGLLAEFTSVEPLVAAVASTREAGYRRLDAYAPFPVHGLAEALGFHRTRVPLLVLIGGIVGGGGGYLLQYWTMVIAYPINVGGRPLHSWPSFIPVTFEMIVLVAGLTAVLGMLALNGLPMPYHPLFHVEAFARATQDRFFLCIEAADPQFELQRTREFLAALGAEEVYEVPE
jgi:Protein of unknown function (DUF3341)